MRNVGHQLLATYYMPVLRTTARRGSLLAYPVHTNVALGAGPTARLPFCLPASQESLFYLCIQNFAVAQQIISPPPVLQDQFYSPEQMERRAADAASRAAQPPRRRAAHTRTAAAAAGKTAVEPPAQRRSSGLGTALPRNPQLRFGGGGGSPAAERKAAAKPAAKKAVAKPARPAPPGDIRRLAEALAGARQLISHMEVALSQLRAQVGTRARQTFTAAAAAPLTTGSPDMRCLQLVLQRTACGPKISHPSAGSSCSADVSMLLHQRVQLLSLSVPQQVVSPEQASAVFTAQQEAAQVLDMARVQAASLEASLQVTAPCR